jgi:hypothetical protein
LPSVSLICETAYKNSAIGKYVFAIALSQNIGENAKQVHQRKKGRKCPLPGDGMCVKCPDYLTRKVRYERLLDGEQKECSERRDSGMNADLNAF